MSSRLLMARSVVKSVSHDLIGRLVLNQRHLASIACADAHKGGKGLVLGLYEKEADRGPRLTPAGEKIDDRLNGKLNELICETKISGRLGRGKVFNNIDEEFQSVCVVGVGIEGIGFNELEMLDEGMENVRVAAGVGARSLQEIECIEVHVDNMDYPEQAAEGSTLAIWRFEENLSKKLRSIQPKLELFDSTDTDSWTRGLFKAEAQNLSRRISEAPANCMTPTAVAQVGVDMLCPCGITVEVRTMEWIEQQRLHSFLMVAKGSCEPPVVLELAYCGTSPEDKPILLVGQGLTFNSGGINLRPCKGMAEFRGDVNGAASILAAMRAAAGLSLPINITAVLPLCENMPSGMAVKPGDVVTLLNAKTMAIRNMDRAGVVVIADPMIYGQQTYKPRLVVDIGSMCKGIKKAVGGGATGIWSNSHFVWKQFQKAGSLTGDRLWRFPLWDFYKRRVANHRSFDLSNDGDGLASSCLAAAVLHELVPCSDWAHLDTFGTGLMSTYGLIPYLRAGQMTGRPTRTLVQFLYQLACPGE
ncbi:cytosol aminopeptidase-like [Drosophila pseudoobscura]|uniref:Cytosol aminopeptidase n=1 Tax=Drosophila pseudoobscura pseudoobscura TaxID=46245 RepID=A0A6I8UY62_DROPS|nr:cytosol aminopeptidase [Drosophila pseudoobscura]XP_033236235.1 cytosol aminopeptidase [Drosophila pseudoobscura]